MLSLNKQLLLSLLIGTACAAAPKSFFEEIINEIDEMQMRFEQRMNRMHEEMKMAFTAPPNNDINSPVLTIHENKANNCLEISIYPLDIKEKTFDASLDQDTNSMIIATPAGSLQIQTDRHLISVGFNHQVKQESDQKDHKPSFFVSSFSQNTKAISAELALEESRIEYDQATQKLTVTIPCRKKMITKIPVIIKEATKSEEK